MPITHHINTAISLASGNSASANFGVQMVVAAHSVNSNRINGPYSSLTAVADAGFTLAAEPAIYGWAVSVFSPRPRVSQVRIGLIDTGENIPTALAAIDAADPASHYARTLLTRTTADAMALATSTEPTAKIAGAQSSDANLLAGNASTAQVSTLTVGGTATDGTYSASLVNDWTGAVIGTGTVVRSTTPATNDDLATALAAALEAIPAIAAITSPIASATNTVPVTFDGLGNHYSWVIAAPAPGTVVAADTAGQVQNAGALMEAAGFVRTWLIYHDDDTEYLDAGWMSRCLSFNLDAPSGAGTWSYHRLAGLSGTSLTDAQKSALTAVNCNWYSPVKYTSGVEEAAFTFPGTMASGRFIDITTTIDLTQARLEEAGMGVFLLAASRNAKVPFTDDGYAMFDAAFSDVCQKLVKAAHYAKDATSPVSGEITPKVTVPLVSSLSSAEKALRRGTMSIELVLAGAINSVGDTATVGLAVTVNL